VGKNLIIINRTVNQMRNETTPENAETQVTSSLCSAWYMKRGGGSVDGSVSERIESQFPLSFLCLLSSPHYSHSLSPFWVRNGWLHMVQISS
jgi:hypothetical protein